MLDSSALNVLALIVALVAQAALYILSGEMLCRWLVGFRPCGARIPEFAFLLGYAGCALIGYLVLIFSTSAFAVPVGVLLAIVAIYVYKARDVTSVEPPPLLVRYREVRGERHFLTAIALAAVFALGVGGYRIPWLLDIHTANGTLLGTNVWDDARTVGFPITLAAYGYPLRSPIAMEMQLLYPLGTFVTAAGYIAWLPQIALPVIIADTMCQAAFYAIVVLIVCAVLVETTWARLLLAGTALIASSYNLWGLSPDTKSAWLNTFFGYYQRNNFYTTIGFRPYSGSIWISNHVVAFAALMMAALWFSKRRDHPDWVVALLFAMLAATSSVDMTTMGAVAATLVLAPRFFASLFRRKPLPTDVKRGIAICAVATALVLIINYPALTGKVDSPYDEAFPRLVTPAYNTGMFLSHNGFYLLLLIGGIALHRRFSAFRTPWAAAALTGVLFSFAFEFHSIWFWRFSAASHLVFGLLCARQLDLSRSRLYAGAWAVTLIPGIVQAVEDIRPRALYRTPAERASAIRWLYQNTPLYARVAEYRDQQGSVAPDVNMLRAGNHGGYRVYDRSHALIGYKDYSERMRSLDASLASNDYILISRDAREVEGVLEQCGADNKFQNARFRVYAVSSRCRDRLDDPDLYNRLYSYLTSIEMQAALGVNPDPYQLPMRLYQRYVILHPDHIRGFRRRLEYLWGAGMWPAAVQWIEPVVAAHPKLAEANYSYAYSLHCGNIDLRKAIAHYDAAEASGYAPFWTTYNRGAAYFQLKEYKAARINLERARAMDPNHADVRNLLDQMNKAGQ